MSDEDVFLSSCLNKNCEFPKKDDRQPNPVELLKNGNEEGDRVWKRRENSIKRKEFEKINRMHLRRGGSTVAPDKVPAEGQNQQNLQPPPADDSAGEEIEKSKNMKKNPYEIVPSNRFKKSCSKVKEVEKVPDSKAKKSPLKTKAITAFGTTFRKAESDSYQLARKKPKSSVDRFGKSKRRKSKDTLLEECGDERRKDQLNPSEKEFPTEVSLSKNKLSIMSEVGEKDKEKRKGTSEISIGKRSNSPKKTSLSKIETKKQSSRGRIEDERAEIGKELSFFEKIQHNLRAYFNPKPVEAMKFDCGEKKVKEGENPDNDESIMIWKDEGIEKGITEDFMKGDQSFFMSIKSEKEIFLEKNCFKRNRGKREVTNGFLPGEISAKGMGSGPQGKISYSYGDKYPYNHNSDYHYKSLFCIKRSNECKEKPRTRSFHRSKTLQKNALAPSPPKASSSISFILEPDQQVENLNSADGMVSAITQIQELHQEINPRIITTSVSCARGFATMNLQEDSLTHLPNYLPGDSVRIPMKGLHSLMRTSAPALHPERIDFRMKRRKTHEIYFQKSTAGICSSYPSLPNTSKSEGAFRFDLPVRPSTPEKGISILSFQDVVSHSKPKHEKPFVRFNNPLFVYTVTETKLIRPPDRKWLNKCPPREQKMTRQSAVEPGGKEELEKEKKIPTKYPETTRKIEEESSSVTLKDIIGLSRKTLRSSPENRGADPESSATTVEDLPRPGKAVTLAHYLEKLMEEKINYLNLEKTTKFRRAQKANFVADSFNFFNLLNKEFLTVKSSNPKIEMLRNVIVEKKEPEMEEYLDMYRKVIRTSLTEPEQHLMDQAKQDLEKYTDMYYDLMRCICLENDGKGSMKFSSRDKNLKRVRRDPVKINRSQVFKSEDNKENIKSSVLWDNYIDKTRPTRPEKSYCFDKIKENRKNHEVGTSKKCNNENSRKWGTAISECLNGGKIPGTGIEPVSEVFSTRTDKETKPENGPRENVKEQNPSSQGKLLLTISVCDEGLVIKQVKDTPGNESDGRDKTQLSSPVGEAPLPLPHRRTDPGTSPSNLPGLWEKPSGSSAKADSDVALYPKSSIDEKDSVEYPMEQHILKFKAFRKLLNNGFSYYGPFNDRDSSAGHGCPKMQKGEKAPEPRKSQPVPKAAEKERKKAADDRKIGTEKVSIKRNREADQYSQTIHDERAKPLSHKGCGFGKRSISPNKGEDFAKKRPWWHADRLVSNDTSTSHKLYHYRKPGNGFKKGTSLLSKGTDKDNYPVRGGKISKKMEARETEEEKEEEEEEEMLENTSDFKTPPGSYFEWRFGIKNFKDIFSRVPTKILSPGELSEGELVCTNEEKEEQEIIKMDFIGGDDEVEDNAKKVSPTSSKSSEYSLKYDVDNRMRTDRERPVNVPPQQDHYNVAQVLSHFAEKISEAWKTAACLKDLMEPGGTRRPGSSDPKEADDPQTIDYFEREENERSQRSKKNEVIESFKNFLRTLTTVFEDNPSEKVVREQIFILAKEFLKPSSDLKSSVTPEQGNATVNDDRTHFAQGISQIPCEIKEMVTKELVSSGINFGETKNLEPADFVAAIKKVGESLKDIYFPGKNNKSESERSEGVVEHQSPKSEVELKPKKIYYRPAKTCSRGDQEGKALTESNMEVLTEKFRRIYQEEQPRETVNNAKPVVKKNPCLDKQPSVYFDALENVQQPGESACETALTGPVSPPGPCSFSMNVNPYGKALVFDKVIEFLSSDNPACVNFGVALLDKIIDKDKNFHSTNEKKATEDNDQLEKKWCDLDKLMDTCNVIEREMSERVEKQTRMEPEDSEKRRDAEKTSQHLRTYVQKMKTLINEIKLPENDCSGSVERIRALGNSRKTNMERQLIGAPDNAPLNHNCLLSEVASFIDTFRNDGCSPDFFAKQFPDKTSGEVTSDPTNFVPTDENYSVPMLESNKHIVNNLRQNIEKRQRKIMALVDEVARKKETGKDNLYQEIITRKVRDLKKCYILLVKLICDPTLTPPKWLKSIESDFKESTGHRKSSAMALLEDLMVRAATEPKNDHSALVSREIEHSRSDFKAKEENNNRNTSSAGSLNLVKINYDTVSIRSPMQTVTNGKKEEAEKEENAVSSRPKTA